jgi:hypothetical protein
MPAFRSGWRLRAVLLGVYLLALSGVASAQEPPKGLRLPTFAASVAAAADWASTYHALKHYELRETNPFLQSFQNSPGQLVTVGAVMDAAAFSTWNLTVGRKHPKVAAAGLWAMAGFRAYLVLHNLRNTQKVDRRER